MATYKTNLHPMGTENQTLTKIKTVISKIVTIVRKVSQTAKQIIQNKGINLHKIVTTIDPTIKVGIKIEINAEMLRL